MWLKTILEIRSVINIYIYTHAIYAIPHVNIFMKWELLQLTHMDLIKNEINNMKYVVK